MKKARSILALTLAMFMLTTSFDMRSINAQASELETETVSDVVQEEVQNEVPEVTEEQPVVEEETKTEETGATTEESEVKTQEEASTEEVEEVPDSAEKLELKQMIEEPDAELLKALEEEEEPEVVEVTATDMNGEGVDFEEYTYFTTWQKAVNFINKKNQSKYTYTIRVMDDITVNGNLPLPTKAKSVILESSGGTLYHSGNITLNTDLVLRELNLIPLKSNLGINLNGRTLYIESDSKDLSAYTISGKGNSAIECASSATFGKLDVPTLRTYSSMSFFTYTDNANVGLFALLCEESDTCTYLNIREGKKLKISKQLRFDGETAGYKGIKVCALDADGFETKIKTGACLFTAAGYINTSVIEICNPEDQSLIVYREGNDVMVGRPVFRVVDLRDGNTKDSST